MRRSKMTRPRQSSWLDTDLVVARSQGHHRDARHATRIRQSLLRAIKSDEIPRTDIPAHVARSLSLILGEAFEEVFGDVRPLAEERTALIAKYKEMLTPEALAQADPVKGRVIFEKTCASCHLLYGDGGEIGPDLTGSNRANLDYILLNSVDPSYDVPEGYRMVLIQTFDGLVLNGVIAEEDPQRGCTENGPATQGGCPQEDIEDRQVSPKSIMPDGQLEG